MKILFLGGKRILGNAIIKKLLTLKNNEIFILTRSRPKNIHKNTKIKFLQIDRNNATEIKKKFKKIQFDIVFDNNCYDFKSFKIIFNNMKNKKNFYIFTSSIITYLNFTNIRSEKDSFKKSFSKINKYFPKQLAYNKKKIELYLLGQKNLKFCIIKMHNIIGKNDHSNKTRYLKDFNEFSMKRLKIKREAFLQFAYIEDIVQIIHILIKRLEKKKKVFNIYNIANDPLSYNDLLKMNLNNKKHYRKINKDIIENLIVNNSRVKKHLNFNFTSNKKILNNIKKLKIN